MIALHLQQVGQVELERRLVAAHDEQVREAVAVDAEQRADAVGVLVVEVDAVLADDPVVDAGLLDLEPGGVDEHVELVLLPWKLGPFGPIFVIPSPWVSTRWTFGRLNVGR